MFEFDVFLGHSPEDRDEVLALAARLQANGLRVGMDNRTPGPGNDLLGIGERTPVSSRVLVLCVSKNAFGSDWARLEAETLLFRDPRHRERLFVPLRLDDAPIKGSIAQFPYIDWRRRDEQELQALVDVCSRQIPAALVDDLVSAGLTTPRPEEVERDQGARDNFSLRTRETLAKRVGWLCSNPWCTRPTSGPNTNPGQALNIGVAAHVSAASPGGPRYDPTMSQANRRSITNGIWLCQNCAKLIDNDESRYTRAELGDWKAEAEARALGLLERPKENPKSTEPATSSVSVAASIDSDAVGNGKLGPSPFRAFGAIGLDERCYVPRASDEQLRAAAASSPFVWLRGDFQSGKTSLLYRHKAWLPEGWHAVHADMEILDKTAKRSFAHDFYAEVAESTGARMHAGSGTAFNWRTVRRLLDELRIAFLVDEPGACTNAQVRWLIEGFGSLSQAAPTRVKVVMSYREGPDPFLVDCGIVNPRHIGSWRTVSLQPFSEPELDPLLRLFPDPVFTALHGHMETIRAKTDLEPHRAQLLLDGLWRELDAQADGNRAIVSFVRQWLAGWTEPRGAR